MRRNRSNFSMLLILLLIVIIELPQDAEAIPAFARRYKLSCSTCHDPFPKLKEYGEDFAGSGFILKEEENDRDYVIAGDDLLRLNRDFPLAVRFDAYAVADESGRVEKDLQIPWGIKLMSGGTLYKNIGYYFYFYMSERGEVAGIEDAYVHFDNIFGSNLDVMVGQFQTSDPLMKRELRLTFEDYHIYTVRVGDSSRTNLTYDRGVMLVYGIESTGTDIAAMVVNGNGKPESVNRKFDDDTYKNYGFRISQSIGDFFSIGGFYYKGKEEAPQTNRTNTLTYWGPDLSLGLGPIGITFQYLERTDTNPLFDGSGKVRTRGTVVEAILAPKGDRSRFLLTGIYNRVDSGLESLNYHTATISGTYLLSRNLRFIAEYTRDLEADANRFVVGTVSAF